MPQEIGVGLIGFGAIGRVHALSYRMLPLCYPNLTLQPRLTAVLVASAEGAARVQRDLPGVRVVMSLEELLADPSVELVDCCAPTDQHAAIVAAALDANRPVFCEKPLATEPQEGSVLASVAAARNLVCGVNYHFRHIPALQEAKRQVAAGHLGEVIGFHLRYFRSSNLKRDRPLNWRFQGSGSGVLLDLGAHLVDLTLHLLGPISMLAARTRTLVAERPTADGTLAPVESDDAAWMMIELADSGLGTAEVSKVVPGAAGDLRIEVYGSNGAFVFDTTDPNHLVLSDKHGQRRVATFSQMAPSAAYPGSELVTAPVFWHLSSLAAYLEALAGKPGSTANFAEAAQVDALLAAARR